MNISVIILSLFFSSLSGRAASKISLDLLKSEGVVNHRDTHLPYNSAHTVTVPGAAAAWCDTVEQFGSGKVQAVMCLSYNIGIGWFINTDASQQSVFI